MQAVTFWLRTLSVLLSACTFARSFGSVTSMLGNGFTTCAPATGTQTFSHKTNAMKAIFMLQGYHRDDPGVPHAQDMFPINRLSIGYVGGISVTGSPVDENPVCQDLERNLPNTTPTFATPFFRE